ncbi:MarR family transcriptional regulator [Candidatus Parcubacteria bacterium]|nr:MarR family transcriptional regulator [Candidatus Parcubacteria bacterium]
MKLGNIRSYRALKTSVNTTTYEAGLVQARAYRALKNYFGDHLAPHGLTMTEWALLGQIYSHSQGLRLSEISEILSVEAPLATNLVTSLEDKGLVRRCRDDRDRRAKLVAVSPAGQRLVPEVEQELRRAMKTFLTGISAGELAAYLKVLQKMAAQAQ